MVGEKGGKRKKGMQTMGEVREDERGKEGERRFAKMMRVARGVGGEG